jgi:hypothetical protein
MPWKKGSAKSGKVYEKLRAKGYGKTKAAKIAVSKTGQALRKKKT